MRVLLLTMICMSRLRDMTACSYIASYILYICPITSDRAQSLPLESEKLGERSGRTGVWVTVKSDKWPMRTHPDWGHMLHYLPVPREAWHV